MTSVCKSYLTFVASERKLAKLYIGSLIRTVGRSLIRLFLPIYLLDLGFTLPQIIVYYYMVKSIVWALATIPSEWISRRWSPEHSIVVGTFFSIANYLFLSSTKSSEISYLLTLGVMSGTSGGLYWLGYHLDFSANSSKDSRGQSLALMRTTTILANAIGPLIGGVVAQWLGFQYMTTMSMFLLALSLVPMLPQVLTKSRAERSESKVAQVSAPRNEDSTINILLTTLDISWVKGEDLLVLFTYGMEQCLGFNAWSIYTSMNFFDQKFELIGMNASLSVFCSLIITLLFGKLIDKNRATALYIGVVSNTSIWIARMFITSRWQATLLDMLFSVSHSLLGNSMFALSYDRANATHIYSYLIIQEVFLAFGQILVWIVCLYYPALYPVFVLGAIVSIVQVFATNNMNNRTRKTAEEEESKPDVTGDLDIESSKL